MATPAKVRKFERSSHEQLQLFVEFCRRHPNILRAKEDPAGKQALWDELANKLNELKGPTRSADKWKETLMNWKNQLKTRSRKLLIKKKITGAGPGTSKALTDLEELALSTFGTVNVDGLYNEIATNIEKPPNAVIQSYSESLSPVSSSPPSRETSAPPSPDASLPPSFTSSLPASPPRHGSARKMKAQELYARLAERLEKKEKLEQAREKARSERDRQMLAAVQSLASSAADILKCLQDLKNTN